MKKLILAGLIAALGVGPAVVLAQTTGGGTSGSGPTTDSDVKGGLGGNTQPHQPGSGGSSSGDGAPSATPGTAPQSDTDKSSVSDKPTNQADCERAGGKWETALQRCDLKD